MSRRRSPGPFRQASRMALADEALGAAIRKTAGLLEERRAAAVAACPGFEALRAWGRERKALVAGALDAHVREFSRNARVAGASVHFATDARDAAKIAADIARETGLREAVKAKSMTAEEVALNEALEAAGTRVTETDLGEFIIQLAGEKPSHILAPAIHRSREQVAELFTRELGAPPGADVDGLIAWARRTLRERFLRADLGITGGNFAVASTGTLVLVTNEGNGRLATTLPRTQIAVVGIDKIVPDPSDLPGFLTLLTRSASGQTVSTYVALLTGPRRPGEEEGPDALHVILLDNGRTRLAGGPFREMLHCLRCGTCLNHCPVYRAVGGHAYASPYPGPMGSVLSPLLWGPEAYPDLPQACTLCGRCAEVCPVRIPLPEYHRRLRGGSPSTASRALARAAASPALYRPALAVARRLLRSGRLGPGRRLSGVREWSTCRELPRPRPGAGFREWWAARGDAPDRPGASPVSPPGGGIGGGEAPRSCAPRDPGADPPLDRYIRQARAAGVEVARVPAGSWTARLAGLLAALHDPVTACPAEGWPPGLWEVLEETLRRAGCPIVRPAPAEGGWAWDRKALDGAGLGITPCDAYLADTGSLVFRAGPGRGTLASLLPPVHLAVSPPGGCLPGLDEYLARTAGLPSRLQLVTGPSRTGDIEGTLSTGVHGPGRVLHWILDTP
ncbi:MAG: LUD domain-containing protein [Deferrisomatales bacterium]|nr:LUD domain-containing protein [Deferrisomatales bacterium]